MSYDISKAWYEKRRLSDADFRKLSLFITSNYGIKLPPVKKVMVEGRLQKRLKVTGIETFDDYLEFVFSTEGKSELLEMIDAISTNKTDFFRESSHFDFMMNHLLPEFSKSGNRMNIWSAASSSGEEIYSLAIVMEEFNSSQRNKINYNILGTDISIDILKKAVNAVYAHERIKDLPIPLRNKYFLRSKDRNVNQVRVIPELRSKVHFKRVNLMDADYDVESDYDIIFCRNVLIYFDKETQESVINKLCRKLKVGGYFFLGHSESIIGKNVPLKQLEPTIYKRV
jgi:chemotaxis protein methyltransferase CheR